MLQKHHYRELEPEIRESLGRLPDGFVTYWLKRFPLLLPHVWLQMQQYRNEDILQAYYPYSFTFYREEVPELADDDNETPPESEDPHKNELFAKSRVYYDESKEKKFYRKDWSPKKQVDWRSQGQEFQLKQDDVRLRDRHHYKKREKKREEMPVWSLPPQ